MTEAEAQSVAGSAPIVVPLLALLLATSCGRIDYDELDPSACALDPACAGVSLGPPVEVDGRSNIYGAGKSVPPAPGGGGGGLLPPLVELPAGIDRIVTVTSATGEISFFGPSGLTGPDGIAGDASATMEFEGISGYAAESNAALVGVFLDDAVPVAPAPPALDRGDSSAASVHPELGQVFALGDGLTGTGEGAVQLFHVPANATRLFLGFADASQFGAEPGAYDDNTGALSVQLQIYLR